MPQRRPKPGIRAIQHRLLIFCEGAKDKSENAYFKALIKDRRNPDNRIEVKVVDTRKNTARYVLNIGFCFIMRVQQRRFYAALSLFNIWNHGII